MTTTRPRTFALTACDYNVVTRRGQIMIDTGAPYSVMGRQEAHEYLDGTNQEKTLQEIEKDDPQWHVFGPEGLNKAEIIGKIVCNVKKDARCAFFLINDKVPRILGNDIVAQCDKVDDQLKLPSGHVIQLENIGRRTFTAPFAFKENFIAKSFIAASTERVEEIIEKYRTMLDKTHLSFVDCTCVFYKHLDNDGHIVVTMHVDDIKMLSKHYDEKDMLDEWRHHCSDGE